MCGGIAQQYKVKKILGCIPQYLTLCLFGNPNSVSEEFSTRLTFNLSFGWRFFFFFFCKQQNTTVMPLLSRKGWREHKYIIWLAAIIFSLEPDRWTAQQSIQSTEAN
jgi:hypothetical protein